MPLILMDYKVLILIFVILLSIQGCATHSLWEKKPTIITSEKEKVYGVSRKILRTKDNGLYVRYNIKEENYREVEDEFPAYSEGVILSHGSSSKKIINRIDQIKSSLGQDEVLLLKKTKIVQTTHLSGEKTHSIKLDIVRREKKTGGESIYEIGNAEPDVHCRNSSFKFLENSNNDVRDDLSSLGVGMNTAPLTFVGYTYFTSEYKVPSLITRTIGTPATLAFDVLTSPVQLFLILTAPYWMPK